MERSHSPQPRRRRSCSCWCTRLSCALTFVAILSIALIGVCAAAYQRWTVFSAETEALTRPEYSGNDTTIVVVMKGKKINLAKTSGWTLEEQLEVLFFTEYSGQEGFERWYLESWDEDKSQDEEWKRSLEGLKLP